MLRFLVVALFAVSAVAGAQRTDDLSALERGVALFQEGDFAGAVRALEEAHADDPDDVDATLLLGIAYYRLHRIDEAEPLLTEGGRATDPDTAASARIFLALIALERDDEGRAHALLEGVGASPSSDLAVGARALLARTARAPLALFAMVRPEYDSNVPLLASAPAGGMSATQADADLLVLGALSYWPIARVPLYIETTVSYRHEAELTDFDFLSGEATVGYDDGALAIIGYGESMALGGAFYAAGGAGQIGYRLQLTDALAPFVRYALRYRDYGPADYAGYTGFTHAGVLGVTIGPRRGLISGDVDYLILREQTRDDELVATGHGANAALRVHFDRVSVFASGTVTWRLYDVGRRDVQSAIHASVALDVTSSFGVIAGAALLHNDSSLTDGDYMKLTAFAGLYMGASP